jgi:single-strand DNA-binding protein
MSLNKVILIGNVGADPDVRSFENGGKIANIRVATNERGYTLSNGQEVPERTDWHTVVLRSQQAEFADKYVKKGSSVYVEGKLRYRSYTDNAGQTRYATEIAADRIEFYSTGRPAGDNQDDKSKKGNQPEGAKNETVNDNIPPSPEVESDNDMPF